LKKQVLEKIVSGGQTGADRAALDWAILRKIPHSGYCPKGRLAEDGRLDAKYQLIQTRTTDYRERTEKNLLESDGTVIFSLSDKLSGGSLDTLRLAEKHKKPILHLHLAVTQPARKLERFIGKHKIQILNIAGPRASKEPGIEGFVESVLDALAR